MYYQIFSGPSENLFRVFLQRISKVLRQNFLWPPPKNTLFVNLREKTQLFCCFFGGQKQKTTPTPLKLNTTCVPPPCSSPPCPPCVPWHLHNKLHSKNRNKFLFVFYWINAFGRGLVAVFFLVPFVFCACTSKLAFWVHSCILLLFKKAKGLLTKIACF